MNIENMIPIVIGITGHRVLHPEDMDISPLASLPKLKKLNINGNSIEDINVLLALTALEEVGRG